MNIWEKNASARWEEEWQERLAGIDGSRIVWHHKAGSPVIRIEVYCHDPKEVAALIEQFGGRDATGRVAKLTARFAPVRDKVIKLGGGFSLRILAGESGPGGAPRFEELWIRPARAFGTGEHATTRMCLEALVEAAVERAGQPWRLLDLGSGSGILALAARRLGARTVEGIDYDEHATRAARENARLNQLRAVRFQTAGLGEVTPLLDLPVDVIAANLFSEVLIRHFDRMLRWLAPGGTLILSGILDEQTGEVETVGRTIGVQWDSRKTNGKWTALVGRKPS